MVEKAHFWTNFLYINKGNIADLQNETFLSAKQTVSLKGIWKFSRKVLAPKAIEWMSGTTCRNVGQQGPPTHQLKTNIVLMCNGSIQSHSNVWSFPPSSLISSIFDNQHWWRKEDFLSLMQDHWVWITGLCAAFSWACLQDKSISYPLTHLRRLLFIAQ